ncbi:MAG: oligosaccharide flippase family protein, partial [Bacteroidota bacterium]
VLLLIYLGYLGLKLWTFQPTFIKPRLLKEILVYGLYIVLGGASGQLIHRVDSIMIPAMLGTLDLGVYTIAFYIGSIIEIPRKMISSISMPIISQAWAKDDRQELKNIYYKSSLNQLIVGLVFFLCVWINIDSLFSLIPKGELFREGKYVVFFIGLTKLVDMSTGLNNEILVHSRLYRLTLLIVFMLAIFIVGSNLLLIPIFGLNGAAGATFLSYFLYNLVKFLIILIAFKMQPLRWKHLLIVGIGISAYLLALLIPASGWILLDIGLKSALICILTLGFVILANLSEDMRQIFERGFRLIEGFVKRKRS